jgi:hypothetical protein
VTNRQRQDSKFLDDRSGELELSANTAGDRVESPHLTGPDQNLIRTPPMTRFGGRTTSSSS